jgi:hydrogenase maturation factor
VTRNSRALLPTGKIPVKLLERLLIKYATAGRGVVVGPSIGIDCAVIDAGTRFILAKTDPITFVSDDIGHYTLNVNANDVAAMGGVPRWFLATILMPEGSTTAASVEKVFKELSLSCRELGVALCGGHTEVTPGLTRPIVVGQMLGVAGRNGIVTAGDARPGDDLILTKGIAIEAASIVAREKAKELAKALPAKVVKRCRDFIKDPGISVVKDAAVALDNGRVHAMHDPTEGGLSMGLHEMAMASGVGMQVYRDRIPVIPESGAVLEHFGLDPLGSIASGALIISVDTKDTARVLGALEGEGIAAARIGVVTRESDGVRMVGGGSSGARAGKPRPLKAFERDEVTRIL